VKIRGDRLKQLAASQGVSVEQLAQAVERTGLEGERAMSAVRNWMAGRDHPRCKATDIGKMAAVLGVAPKDLARFVSQIRMHRGSPRKAKLLIDLIRGRSVDDALNQLTFTTKRAAVNIRKALSAAIADAEQAEADVTTLFVSESRVDDGGMMKRFQPKDRGRAHPIEKRFSNITVAVEERAAKA
jgi:large subunit ribosomal protein L22